MAERDTRVQRSVFLGSLLLSAGLSLVLVLRDPSAYTLALAALGGVAVLGLFAPPRWAGLLLAVGVLNAVTVLPELALRAAGFQYASGIQFGYPAPELFWHLLPDQELLWTLPPDEPGVSSLGFLGADPRVPKPAGVMRLLFLGDSCSQQGHPQAWPDIAVHLLASSGTPADGVNLSMSGYTSHQGRVLAERHGERMQPDVVFVYYGWNDHWLAFGAVDAEKRASLRGERLYRGSRLLQAARRAAVSSGIVGNAAPLDETRVPEDGYDENLRAIVGRFRALGVPVVLVTAPSSHGALGVPGYLVEERFAPDADAVLRLHARYNEIVRAVSAEPGVLLLDLAATFEREVDLRASFLEDGIHLTEAGRWEVARRALDLLRREGLVP